MMGTHWGQFTELMSERKNGLTLRALRPYLYNLTMA